jgi:hypothetical protein
MFACCFNISAPFQQQSKRLIAELIVLQKYEGFNSAICRLRRFLIYVAERGFHRAPRFSPPTFPSPVSAFA